VKNPFSADLFQGDMLVEPEVKKIALAGGDVSKATAGRKRGAPIPKPGGIGIWPKGVIPYLIDSSLDGQFEYLNIWHVLCLATESNQEMETFANGDVLQVFPNLAMHYLEIFEKLFCLPYKFRNNV
jgi:hypothetical protein